MQLTWCRVWYGRWWYQTSLVLFGCYHFLGAVVLVNNFHDEFLSSEDKNFTLECIWAVWMHFHYFTCICLFTYIYIFSHIYIYIYLSGFGHRATGGRLVTFKLKKLGNRTTGGRSPYRHNLILEENYWILKLRSLPWSNLNKFPDFGIGVWNRKGKKRRDILCTTLWPVALCLNSRLLI